MESAPDASVGISIEELQLAGRNHSMPLEGLAYPITPIGMHYLLTHFDIPVVDARTWRLSVDGRVRRPREFSLEELQERPAVTLAVTLECAGNGRARLSPRPLSQPWLNEAVGTAEWRGTPLRGILEDAGLLPEASEIVFAGLDRGIQDGVEHVYERSLRSDEAMREEVLLAYAINGQPLPPQHGFPLRLIVPGWYGMTHVKWLKGITAITEPFQGLQQAVKYHVKRSEHDSPRPVSRILPRSLMIPPGIPDFLTRTRYLSLGRHEVRGRAWSGWGPIRRVEMSTDGGRRWADAQIGQTTSLYAWCEWTFEWDAATPGQYELCSRATDAAGNTQPLDQAWTTEGVCNNAVQRVRVIVPPAKDSPRPSGEG
jgi:DMSO/TMAO reductase YedYZ molybdopterin-dependent catalytic subunit